jgi:hypothetical protein
VVTTAEADEMAQGVMMTLARSLVDVDQDAAGRNRRRRPPAP